MPVEVVIKVINTIMNMNTIKNLSIKLQIYALAALVATAFLLGFSIKAEAAMSGGDSYNPVINPSDFSTNITNKYFSLPVGIKFESQGETEDGTEIIEISVPGDTKMVMGVKTLVYRDKVWLDGELIEDTKDYLAQDKAGNVWYFGENVNNYENGKLKDNDGTWIAGVDGALPGIWMKANPVVGEEYRQEYYKGEAEDFARVLSVTEKVKVPAGTFTNCLKTLDVNPLDPIGTDEHKYYCPKVKGFALEVGVESGERIELTKITQPTKVMGNETARLQNMISLLLKLISLLQQQEALR
jgi:hypothetical protein